VRRRLADTRAAALIARNEREQAEEQSRIRAFQGARAMAGEFLKVSRLTRALDGIVGGTPVGGWVKTVCSEAGASVTQSPTRPSSVAALSEVSFEGMGSSSGVGGRLSEYKTRLAALELAFESVPHLPVDRLDALRGLAVEFADVAGPIPASELDY